MDIPQAVLEERMGIPNMPERSYDNVIPNDGPHAIPHNDVELYDVSSDCSSHLIGYA